MLKAQIWDSLLPHLTDSAVGSKSSSNVGSVMMHELNVI
jgi:hypothetical protein